jgi:hypothetical protein
MGTASTSACAIHPSFIDEAAASSDMDIDQLVAAFVRIRGVDRLEGAVITRCWLAADMGVPVASLDGLLKLLRWQSLIGLPDEHLITLDDAEAVRAIAIGLPAKELWPAEQRAEGLSAALPIAAKQSVWLCAGLTKIVAVLPPHAASS